MFSRTIKGLVSIQLSFLIHSQQSANESVIHPLWTPIAILLLVVIIALAITSIALGIIICRTRKDVKSWLSSKLTTDQGSQMYEHMYLYTNTADTHAFVCLHVVMYILIICVGTQYVCK